MLIFYREIDRRDLAKTKEKNVVYFIGTEIYARILQ